MTRFTKQNAKSDQLTASDALISAFSYNIYHYRIEIKTGFECASFIHANAVNTFSGFEFVLSQVVL